MVQNVLMLVYRDSEADFTIKAAESLLQTKFYAFQHKKHTDIEIQRAIADYSVQHISVNHTFGRQCSSFSKYQNGTCG